jgi:hypothetical protein
MNEMEKLMKQTTKENVFERAARTAAQGTSAECIKVLGELAALERSERAAWESSAPPSTTMAMTGSGRSYSRQVDSGSRYHAASLAGDTETVAKLEAEHGQLTVRRHEIERLTHQLVERKKVAVDQERVAAAPAKCEALIAEISSTLDSFEAAAEELTLARTRIEAAVQSLQRQRELAGDDAQSMSLETFYRTGRALAQRLVRPTEQTGDRNTGAPGATIEPLFGSSQQGERYARALLAAPSPTLLARIRAVLKTMTGLDVDSYRDRGTDQEVNMRVQLWHRERVRLLNTGNVAAAAKLGPPEFRPGSKGRASFGEVA